MARKIIRTTPPGGPVTIETGMSTVEVRAGEMVWEVHDVSELVVMNRQRYEQLQDAAARRPLFGKRRARKP